MKKHVSSKKALLASIMSLVLCCAMLLGTTFAWFTDTVQSGTNQIQAGNLDIDLQYCKPDGTGTTDWATVEAATTLFSDVTNWEPGAVSVVYLQIKNLGNLALNYKLAIKAADIKTSEDGGKLSDVLKTKVVDLGTTMPADIYTRDTAKAAAVTFDDLTNYEYPGHMTNQGDTQYLAVIVYFPEEVGNTYEKDGVTYTINSAEHPEIALGIALTATQYPSEADGFNNQYDNLAQLPVVIISLPAIQVTRPVAVSNNKVTAPVTLSSNTFSVEIKEETKVASGTDSFTATVTPQADVTDPDIQAAITAAVAEALDNNPNALIAAYEVDVIGVADDNDVPVQLIFDVGKGLSNVKIFHGTEEVSPVDYNPETGKATFSTTTFSPFVAAFQPSVAFIQDEEGATQYFATTEDAFESAAGTSNGATVTLIGAAPVPVVVPEGASVENGKVIKEIDPDYDESIDLEGKTYDCNFKVLWNSYSNTSISNGTINGNLTYEDGSNYANYELNNLTVNGDLYLGNRYFSSGSSGIATLNNVTVTGTVIVGSGINPLDYAFKPYSSWGCGSTVRIRSGSYNKVSINDAYGSELLVSGGTFKQSVSAYLESPAFETANDNGTFTVDLPNFASVGGTEYKNMEAAFTAALASNGTVTLLVDATMEKPVTIGSGKSITLDLAGHKLVVPDTAQNAFFIQGGALTINDSSADETGSLRSTASNGELVKFKEPADSTELGTFTLTGGSLYAVASDAIGVSAKAFCKFYINISGGLIDAYGNTINCSNSGELHLEMTGGMVRSSDRDAIYVGSANDKITREDVLNISGGTLKVDKSYKECVFVSSPNYTGICKTKINISGNAQVLGSSSSGRAFYINCGTIAISNGTINGQIMTSSGYKEPATVEITGGKFAVSPKPAFYDAASYDVTQTDGYYVVTAK